MFGLGLRLCRDRQRAEDLVQETFLQAFRHWGKFEGRSSPGTWLYSIAARVCRRFHRRRAGEPVRMASLDDLLPFGEAGVPALPGEPGAGASMEEARERVGEAIAGLPPEFRMPLVLKDIQGFSIEEVARVLGLREATVKTRIHRARLRIRKVLVEGGRVREGPPPAYPLRVCLDLLRAKQEAIDRGVPFPVGNEVVCERCRSVFASLDLGADVCASLATGEMPDRLRKAILESTGSSSARGGA